MIAIASQDLAIANAIENGTFTIEKCFSKRFQDYHFVLGDELGIIEVQLTPEEANARFFAVMKMIGYPEVV